MKEKIKLSAINPVIIDNIPHRKETAIKGKEYISYGEGNKYPTYLWNLYNTVATLGSIINGTVDFICGDKITILNDSQIVNKANDTIEQLVRKIAFDKMIFGGYAIEVIRNFDGSINEINHIDFMKLRCDANNENIYYSNDWNAWSPNVIKIPKYSNKLARSIYYEKGSSTKGVYPIPIYGSAIISCEIEKCINEFHLNNINNGFASNMIVNLNNGVPEPEQKEEIERMFNEKFGGYQNSGRIVISYNDGKDNATSIERIDEDNFDQKYTALSERSKQQIFTAFRATPNIFGLPTATTGFSEQEYKQAFNLYNRTVVKPIQKQIISTLNEIYDNPDYIKIEPFTLN